MTYFTLHGSCGRQGPRREVLAEEGCQHSEQVALREVELRERALGRFVEDLEAERQLGNRVARSEGARPQSAMPGVPRGHFNRSRGGDAVTGRSHHHGAFDFILI